MSKDNKTLAKYVRDVGDNEAGDLVSYSLTTFYFKILNCRLRKLSRSINQSISQQSKIIQLLQIQEVPT